MSKQKMTEADRQTIEAFRQSKYEKFDNDDTLTDEERDAKKAKLDEMIQETINERYETDDTDNTDITENTDNTNNGEGPEIGEREREHSTQAKEEEIDDDDDLVR